MQKEPLEEPVPGSRWERGNGNSSPVLGQPKPGLIFRKSEITLGKSWDGTSNFSERLPRGEGLFIGQWQEGSIRNLSLEGQKYGMPPGQGSRILECLGHGSTEPRISDTPVYIASAPTCPLRPP